MSLFVIALLPWPVAALVGSLPAGARLGLFEAPFFG